MLPADSDSLSIPDLFSTSKEPDGGNGEEILVVLLCNQTAFDLTNLRSNRPAEGDPSDIIDVERDHRAQFGRGRRGLQRIAARGQADGEKE